MVPRRWLSLTLVAPWVFLLKLIRRVVLSPSFDIFAQKEHSAEKSRCGVGYFTNQPFNWNTKLRIKQPYLSVECVSGRIIWQMCVFNSWSSFVLLLYLLYVCSAIRYDYRGNSVMLIPYYSPISNTSSITMSESLSVTHWISIQLCHMGKQISKTSPGQERYPGLEGLRNYYSLSIVIWREGESLSKAYAMIYCRFSSKMGFYIVSEKWLRHYVDIRFARGSEAMPSRWLDFVCVCLWEQICV